MNAVQMVPSLYKTSRRRSSPFEMVVEIITTLDGLERLKPDYDRLNEVTHNGMPFALHEWHVAWWTHLATHSARVEDSLMIHVVRDGSDRCIAIIPFIATERRFGPLRLRTLSLLGPDPYLTEFRAPLVEPGYEKQVARLIRNLLASDDRWHWIHWSGMSENFAEAISAGPAMEWQKPNIDHVLDLPSTWEALRSGLKRNIRESLRHGYNSLKRDGLDFEFEVAESPADVERALEEFLVLHGMRADMAGTIRHINRFEGGKTREFLRDVCMRLAERGSTRIFLLRIRGQVVAARIGFVVGERLYLYFSGFDPEWSKYGVMTTAVAEAIKYAIGQRLSTVSLSAGTDVSKTRWGARQVTFAEAHELRPGLASELAYKAYRRAKNMQDEPGKALAGVLKLLPARTW